MGYALLPCNKHMVVENLDDAGKTAGGLYMPGNVSNQYRLARVVAFDEEAGIDGLVVGDTVLYDTIGAVTHRIGSQSITTVKTLNVLGIVREVK